MYRQSQARWIATDRAPYQPDHDGGPADVSQDGFCQSPVSPMPFLTIAFPQFDPIAIAIGPIAIRWYALAYIGGIVLGWIYARALIKNEKLWGGPAPISLAQMDDFILWVTVGIIVGGRSGYVLFYNLPFFLQHPLEIFELWKGGMSFHGGFLGCVAEVMLFARSNGISILSLGDITTAVGPIGLL